MTRLLLILLAIEGGIISGCAASAILGEYSTLPGAAWWATLVFELTACVTCLSFACITMLRGLNRGPR